MIENVNTANNDNAPAVQIGMILELLEKTVFFVGHWPV